RPGSGASVQTVVPRSLVSQQHGLKTLCNWLPPASARPSLRLLGAVHHERSCAVPRLGCGNSHAWYIPSNLTTLVQGGPDEMVCPASAMVGSGRCRGRHSVA